MLTHISDWLIYVQVHAKTLPLNLWGLWKHKWAATRQNKQIDCAIWAASWQNEQNDCAQRRLRSAWASAQSDQSLLCAQSVVMDPSFLHADSEDSDQTGRMPRLFWVFAGCTVILLVLSWGGLNMRNSLRTFFVLFDIFCLIFLFQPSN